MLLKTSYIINQKNETKPHYKENITHLLYDYGYYTELESWVKKEREKAKKECIKVADKPDDVEGQLIISEGLVFSLAISAPSQRFDKEVFIEKVSNVFNIPMFKLRELATVSVVEGSPRRMYKVIENE